MKFFLAAGVAGACLLMPFGVMAETDDRTNASDQDDATKLETIAVEDRAGGRAADTSESYTPKTPVSSATGLPMTLRETPQSVSVTTRTKMDDFGQYTVNDVLANTTGVTVQQAETDRTYYTARGFDIANFQYDGMGLPLSYGIARGQLDTAVFERVEVIRGANGLMTGTGNPSATVNFVRKRPTRDTQVGLGLTGGSWDTYRADADVSGSLNDRIRGRFVTAYRDGDSYLDRYQKERGVAYGVLEMDLTDNTLFTVGYSFQNENADSPMWGTLPLYYQDGSATDYDVSTSTAADWSYWDHDTENGFAELVHNFENGWQAKAMFTYRKVEGDSKLLYVYGVPDRNGNGLFPYSSLYENDERQEIYDLRASGPFEVAGRVHQMVVGVNRAKGDIMEESNFADDVLAPSPFAPGKAFDGSYPEPASFDAFSQGSDWEDRYRSAYLATRLSLADPLTLVTGARYQDVESTGESYGQTRKSSANELTPYAGLIYDVTDRHSVYASHTRIFTPQTELKADGSRLDPVDGENNELGLKSEWFNGRLNTSLVAFRTEQNNLAETANPGAAPNAQFFDGADFHSHGYEAEVSGELQPGWHLTAGYTWLEIEDEDEDEVKPEVPREIARLATTYRPPALEKLKLGMTANWQDSIHNERDFAPGKNKQESYYLVNLMAGYDITDQLSTTLRVNNVTDEKYLTTLRWDQGYYGAPRNANLSLNYQF